MKRKFKLLYQTGTVAITLIMVFLLSGCKDDDNPNSNELSGTTWTVISDSEGDFDGLKMTFNKNGKVSFIGTIYEGDEPWEYAVWTYENEILKIVLGEDGPDDYIDGKFVIDGNKATYTYSWHDYFGEWDRGSYIMILQKNN